MDISTRASHGWQDLRLAGRGLEQGVTPHSLAHAAHTHTHTIAAHTYTYVQCTHAHAHTHQVHTHVNHQSAPPCAYRPACVSRVVVGFCLYGLASMLAHHRAGQPHGDAVGGSVWPSRHVLHKGLSPPPMRSTAVEHRRTRTPPTCCVGAPWYGPSGVDDPRDTRLCSRAPVGRMKTGNATRRPKPSATALVRAWRTAWRPCCRSTLWTCTLPATRTTRRRRGRC